MIQATNEETIRNAVNRFGVAPGAQAMLNLEREAALFSISNQLYITWRVPSAPEDCTRVGPGAKCFCGHRFESHNISKRTNPCTECPCKIYKFIPQRPEEVGEWWLPRRKEFNVLEYRVKCKCSHTHELHDPINLRCKSCSCFSFSSAFLCLVCDKHWEVHETIYETELDRKQQGRTYGESYMPLNNHRDLQTAVFQPQRGQFVRKAPQIKNKSLGPSLKRKK
jgi:Protein FAM221A/B